jgi:hypothetical protein
MFATVRTQIQPDYIFKENAVFWDITLCGFVTRATRRNISEDGILHSHRCENIKSFISLTGWVLLW